MNDLRSMSRLPGDDLDGMLREFYRAEMPDPWPAMKAPQAPERKPTRLRPWWRQASRLAIAASVGFLLVGYLNLASVFPRSKGKVAGGDIPAVDAPDISKLPQRHRTESRPGIDQPVPLQTPAGRPALGWERKVPDGGLLLQYQLDPKRKR